MAEARKCGEVCLEPSDFHNHDVVPTARDNNGTLSNVSMRAIGGALIVAYVDRRHADYNMNV